MLVPSSVQHPAVGVDQVDDDALAAWLSPAAGFPTVDLVDAAAAMFLAPLGTRWVDVVSDVHGRCQRQVKDQAPNAVGVHNRRAEGRDFAVQVAAGVVGVRMLDHERRARTEEAAAARDARMPLRPGMHVDESGRVVWHDVTPTRVIEEWSRKSRSNMTRALSELDYAPMFADGQVPAMVTLTYPGRWADVAPSGKAVKEHVRTLMKRWGRRWGAEPVYLWKLEFQRRGAPHLHLFIKPPEDARSIGGGKFQSDWLAATWAEVVGAEWCGTPCWERRADGRRRPCCERGRHRLAGTGIDVKEGARCKDPKRLAVYFKKHGGAAGGKEYQHQVPMLWRTPTTGPGRFWGYVGVARVRREVYVSEETYVRVRRTLRRLSRSMQLRRTITVQRVRRSTGVVSYRQVTRRWTHLDHGGLAGGFVLVNDGPALAAALASLSEQRPGSGAAPQGRLP